MARYYKVGHRNLSWYRKTRDRIKYWWQEFICPTQHPNWQRFAGIKNMFDSYLLVIRSNDEGVLHTPYIYRILSSPEDFIVCISWLFPWKAYYFMDIGKEFVNKPYIIYPIPKNKIDSKVEAIKLFNNLFKENLYKSGVDIRFAPAPDAIINDAPGGQVNEETIEMGYVKVQRFRKGTAIGDLVVECNTTVEGFLEEITKRNNITINQLIEELRA